MPWAKNAMAHYMHCADTELHRVDPLTGISTFVGSGLFGYAGDIAVEPIDVSRMFGAMATGAGADADAGMIEPPGGRLADPGATRVGLDDRWHRDAADTAQASARLNRLAQPGSGRQRVLEIRKYCVH